MNVVANPRNSTQIRSSNIRALLNAIKENMPISKRDLQKITGLSWGAVSTLTGLLYDHKYVVSAGKQTTNVGRRPSELAINSDDHFIVGIDLHISGLCGVVTDMKGRIVKEWVRLFAHEDYTCIMETLFSLLDDILLNTFHDKHILGIGLAVQGIVDVENGVSISLPQAANWHTVPLKEILEERYGCLTMIMHDPQCIMFAEKAFGESFLNIAQNAVMLRLDDGIGISLLINGKMHMGSNGRAGEIGHIPVEKDGPVCTCGNKGCLEEFASGRGLVHRFVERVNQGEETDADINSIHKEGYKELAIAAQRGDTLCSDLFEQMGCYLGIALSSVVNILRPELVVLYGELTQYRSLFFDQVEQHLQAHLYADTQVKLLFSSLGRNAAAQGAALMVSDYTIETLDLPVDAEEPDAE